MRIGLRFGGEESPRAPGVLSLSEGNGGKGRLQRAARGRATCP